jgi:hypothetical protein
MGTLSEQPDRERRFRIILALIAGAVSILAILICASFAYVAPFAVDFNYRSPTPNIPVTGTITRISGITLPPDAVMLAHKTRDTGGAFDYRTALRPQQIYDFYLATMSLRGTWTFGSDPVIEAKLAKFRFFSTYIPRLTLVDVKCDDTSCNVHVDY